MVQDSELFHLPGFYDPASSISHLFGAGLFLILGLFLVRRYWGRTGPTVYLTIYVVSTVFLLSMSAVYHMLERGGTPREVMERLDHGAIFFLIAGTFTPIHGILFRGWLRWGILFLVWGAAITGVTLKTIFFEYVPEWLSLLFYLGLGWFGVCTMVCVGRRYGFRFVRPLFLGGIAYSVGGALDFLRWPTPIPGVINSHAVFHLAILIAALLHWRFIWDVARQAYLSPKNFDENLSIE
jgi:channel protein (hemolysin III family)